MSNQSQLGWTVVIRRVVATCCAVMVFGLGLLAVSPTLHEHLHQSTHSSCDDGCAVVLFAGGVTLSSGVLALPRPTAPGRDQTYFAVPALFVASPRYLLPPPHGPPLS